MRNKLLYSLIGAMLILPGIVQAETITIGPDYDTIDFQMTNWPVGTEINLPKFDSNLGTLTAITLELEGYIEGSASFESKDAAPATITMDLKADITLQHPDDLTPLVAVIPVSNTSDDVTAYDGTDDYAGTSGKSYLNLAAKDSDVYSATAPLSASDLALFSFPGGGTMILPITAHGKSTGSGAGNLLTQFVTYASAKAWVTYEYTAAATPGSEIPEPGTMLLLGTGLIGLLGYNRRRKTA